VSGPSRSVAAQSPDCVVYGAAPAPGCDGHHIFAVCSPASPAFAGLQNRCSLSAMTLPRRRFLLLAATAPALPATRRIARAQASPSRPITMVVPVSAGGAMDTLARIVAEGMRPSLGQPIIVENVTGAAGRLGVGRVASASPDGYTLIYAAFATHVINGAVYALPYDVVEDFEPVALISSTPWLIAIKNGLAANDLAVNHLKGLIALLKANPHKASAGTVGPWQPRPTAV